MSELRLPRLYAIAHAELLAGRRVLTLAKFARELRGAGVTLVQYRDKTGSPQEILRAAATLREVFAGSGATLVLNDRADLALLAGFDGVHVGQEDLSPEDARRVLGGQTTSATHPSLREGWATRLSGTSIVGVSTHSEEQVRIADTGCADYIAIGPVFATGTKENPDPVVGLESVCRARALTSKPLVAIGGITRDNARSVIEVGADSVAVISGLFAPGESVEQVARDFLAILG